MPRFRAKGIVVLNGFEESIVTNLYDIARGGLSFMLTCDEKLSENPLDMDILIFDCQSGFEHFIEQVKAQIKSRKLYFHSESNDLLWRFGAEFCDSNISLPNMNKNSCGITRGRNVSKITCKNGSKTSVNEFLSSNEESGQKTNYGRTLTLTEEEYEQCRKEQ